ncbi:MAG: hypothetical protein VX278_14945, partial [Myxococcota bacterium]|nr:hypothetical protein [Myxococcota bacterium]
MLILFYISFYSYIIYRILAELTLELILYTFWLPFYKETLLYAYYYFGRDPYGLMERFIEEKNRDGGADSNHAGDFV